MKHELSVDEGQMHEDWRKALGIPDTVWPHDEHTKTIADLSREFGLGDQATRDRVEAAVEAGLMCEGCVKGDRGHFITAYRLKD